MNECIPTLHCLSFTYPLKLGVAIDNAAVEAPLGPVGTPVKASFREQELAYFQHNVTVLIYEENLHYLLKTKMCYITTQKDKFILIQSG